MVSPISAWSSSPIALTVIGLLQPSAHSRQRRPQVVRDIVAHLLDLSHQGFDAVQHQVEVLRDAIPFVMGAAERDALDRGRSA